MIISKHNPLDFGFAASHCWGQAHASVRSHTWHALLPVLLAGILNSSAGAQNLQDSGLELPGVWAGQAAWGDYDDDGDIDLGLIGEITVDGQCERIARVMRNDSALLIEDVAQSQRLTGVYFGDLGWADYDSDGDLDLGVAGWDANGEESLRLYLNEEGSEPAERLLTFDISQVDDAGDPNLKGVRYAALSWVDYDNDGDLDLVVSGMESIATSLTHVYRNTDGSLQLDAPNSESIINVHSGDLAWADYDSDGDLDLAISGENVTSDGGEPRITEFYVNNPVGTLTLDSDLNLPFDALVKGGALAWADYDSDGNPDLAISGRDGAWNRGLHLYRNRPAGTFTRDTDFALNTSQMIDGQLDWVDYDNDGDPDLAASGRTIISAFEAEVYDNRDGSVTGASVEQDLEGLAGVAVWGDYDNDGRVDLVTSGVDEAGESRTVLYSNLGITTVNTAPEAPTSLNPVEVTSTGALFRWSPGSDAESDAISYNIRVGTAEGVGDIVSASLAVGPGNVGVETSYILRRSLAPDTYFWSVQSVDGAYARSAFSQIDAFVVGRFVSSNQQIRNLTESAMTWGDYDGDGDDDLAIMGRNRSGETQSLLYANDDGLLALLESDIVSLEEGDLAWGDYDGDGDLDLIISGEDAVGTRAVRLYQTLAGGVVQEALRFTPTLSESSVDWGDVDNDGDVDLLLMGQSDVTDAGSQLSFTEIWQNDGAGDFDTLGVDLVGLNNGEGLFADIDNDGDLDLATTGVSSSGTRQFIVYDNDPVAGFTDTGNELPGMESSDIAFGDYDRDGDLDLAAGGVLLDDSPFAAIFTNDGAGAFAQLDISLPGIQGGDLAWGDYDNDQDLDLIVIGNIGQQQKTFSIYENTIGRSAPDAAFAIDEIPILAGVDFSSVALADVDGDGDLDLVSSGTASTPSTAVNDNLTAQQSNANILPSAPTGLRAEDTGNDVTLSWLPASDFGDPPAESLTYNLRVGAASSGNSIVSGHAALGLGNAGHNLSRSIGDLSSGTYFWSVQAVDAAFSRSAWSDEGEFIIDTVAPEVEGLTFNRSALGIDQTVTLALEFIDTHSGVDATVEPQVEATIAGEAFQFQSLQYTGQTWSGELTILSTMPSGAASVSVRGLQDLKGNSLAPYDSAAAFTVDTELPGVTSAEPAFSAIGVASTTNQIRILFSEPLDEQTVVGDNFQITVAQSPLALALDPSYDSESNTVILTPGDGLLPGTLYNIEVSAAVEDLAGNGPANAISWTFSTAVPQLLATEPAAGAVDVPIAEGRISASFDGDIITALLGAADAVQVLREGDAIELSETPIFDAESSTLSFDLGEGLKPGSRYEVILDGLLAGPLQLAEGDFRWSFTTAVPQVSSLTPVDGDATVSVLDRFLSVVFDDLVDQAAIEGSVSLLEQGLEIATTVEEYNPATGALSFEPADGLRVGTSYQVIVSGSVGGPLRQAIGDYRWSFSTAVPELVAVEPAAGLENVTIDLAEAVVAFNVPLDERDLDGNFALSREGIPVEMRADDPIDRGDGRYGLAPADGWQVGSGYTVQINSAVTGPLGTGQPISWSFQTAIPDTASLTPAAGDSVVSALEETITVVFDNDIDDSELAENVRLFGEGQRVQITTPVFDSESKTLSFGPAARLRGGTSYQVLIARSVAGPRAPDDFRWGFATSVASVVSAEPEGGSAVTAGPRRVRLAFSGPLDDDLINSQNIAVARGGEGLTLPGDEFLYDAQSLVVSLPEIDLIPGSAYEVAVSARLSGPRATTDLRLGFTTLVPDLVTTSPAAGSSISAGGRRIELVFSAALEEGLINSQNIRLSRGGDVITLADSEFDYNNETFTVSLPEVDFVSGSSYEVVVGSRLGGPLADRPDDQFSFVTDLPTLVETNPAFASEGVSVTTAALRIVFSAPVAAADPSGFQLRSRRILDLQEDPALFELTPITGFGFEDAAQTTVNFLPEGGFQPFTEYELVIDRSVLGERAESGFDGTFKTAGVLADAAAGGTVTNAERSIELYFPPNALSGGSGEVIIRPADDQPVEGQDPVSVGRAWEIDIGSSTLRKPVTLSFGYDRNEIDANEALQIGVFRRSGDDWIRIGGTPDLVRARVNTTVEDFSTFGLFIDTATSRGSSTVADLDCQPRAFSPAGGLRASTDISFQLTGPSDVTVRIFNASGRLERVIERGFALGPGRHTLPWNGRDDDGKTVASGLYIVVVSASGEQAEKVVAVVR